MEASSSVCKEISEVSSGFTKQISDASSGNQTAMHHLFKTNDRIFMSLAKLDHVAWKVNTYLSVLQEKPSFTYVDHHDCRLGKWYYEGDGQSFSHSLAFKALEGPHSRVHEGTKAVFGVLTSKGSATALSAAIKTMEDGSDGVFQALDRMLEQKR